MNYDKSTIEKVTAEILAKNVIQEVEKEINRQRKVIQVVIGKAITKLVNEPSFLSKLKKSAEEQINEDISDNGFENYIDDKTWKLVQKKVAKCLLK